MRKQNCNVNEQERQRGSSLWKTMVTERSIWLDANHENFNFRKTNKRTQTLAALTTIVSHSSKFQNKKIRQ